MMDEKRELPEGLRYPLMLDVNAEEYSGHSGRLTALKLSCELTSGSTRFSYSDDYLPDKELSREKLRYRVDYLSRNFRAALHEALARIFNESALATEIEYGEKNDVEAALKRFSRAIPVGAKARMPERRGPPAKLTKHEMNNMDLTHDDELTRFQKAKLVVEEFQKHPTLGDWRERLKRMLGPERFVFAEKGFTSLDHYEAQPGMVTFAYLTHRFRLSKRQLERVITKARTRRAELGARSAD